ncbi:cytochrome b [Aurantiacibacter rhizosphaerae]|nr:cytochrome b [Aurantiacibacter rhizosphaerae]
MQNGIGSPRVKYPLSMRILHWIRAVIILGLIWSGWYMTELPETTPMETFDLFYPNHKQFGVLVWLLALVHLTIRYRNRRILPQTPSGLHGWEKALSHAVHYSIIALTLLVPLLGYGMSSTFTQSDGVPFFFFGEVPEILPKNDNVYEVFDMLHKYSAYVLLGLIVLHVAGALKHRWQDSGGETDVLPRML